MHFLRKLSSALALCLCPLITFADTGVITHSTFISAVPDIDTSQYVTGDLVGEKLTLSLAARESIGMGTIMTVLLEDADKETVDIDVVFFSADPSGTTFTDNGAFDVADADLAKIVCVVSLTSHKDWNDNGTSVASGIGCPFKIASAGTTLYAALVSRATVTYTAATDLTLTVGISQD